MDSIFRAVIVLLLLALTITATQIYIELIDIHAKINVLTVVDHLWR
jgi:hypothetical protein